MPAILVAKHLDGLSQSYGLKFYLCHLLIVKNIYIFFSNITENTIP